MHLELYYIVLYQLYFYLIKFLLYLIMNKKFFNKIIIFDLIN